jgi:hypothetical protein
MRAVPFSSGVGFAIQIWNRALTQQEIQQSQSLFHQGWACSFWLGVQSTLMPRNPFFFREVVQKVKIDYDRPVKGSQSLIHQGRGSDELSSGWYGVFPGDVAIPFSSGAGFRLWPRARTRLPLSAWGRNPFFMRGGVPWAQGDKLWAEGEPQSLFHQGQDSDGVWKVGRVNGLEVAIPFSSGQDSDAARSRARAI